MSMLPFEIKPKEIHFISESEGSLKDLTKHMGVNGIYLEVINLYLYTNTCLVFHRHRAITPPFSLDMLVWVPVPVSHCIIPTYSRANRHGCPHSVHAHAAHRPPAVVGGGGEHAWEKKRERWPSEWCIIRYSGKHNACEFFTTPVCYQIVRLGLATDFASLWAVGGGGWRGGCVCRDQQFGVRFQISLDLTA